MVVSHVSCTTVLMHGATSSMRVTGQRVYGTNIYIRRKGIRSILPCFRHLYTPSGLTIYWVKQNISLKFNTYTFDSTLQTKQINYKFIKKWPMNFFFLGPYNTFDRRSELLSCVEICAVLVSPIATDSQRAC